MEYVDFGKKVLSKIMKVFEIITWALAGFFGLMRVVCKALEDAFSWVSSSLRDTRKSITFSQECDRDFNAD